MSTDRFLSENLTALAAIQPGFVLPPFGDGARLVDGAWRIHKNGNLFAIHSRNPGREAERLAAELVGAGEPPPHLVIIGLGVGYLLDALEQMAWHGKVLALEPEPDTVRALLSRRDWRPWLVEGRLRILAWQDFAGATGAWKTFGDDARDPIVWVNPVVAQVRPFRVADAKQVLARIHFDAKANAEARKQFARPYVLNTLRNLRAIASEGDVAALDGLAQGQPVIVVAAGPSLDKALPLLREVQRRAVIVTVDTALRPLLAAGIAPHIAVAVDPTETNARHLTGLPPCPDTYLVTEGSVDPLAVKSFEGRTFFFRVADHQPWPWFRTLDRQVAELRAWGSVLTTAFDLALRMGADPLVFVGADLSYTEDRPYCRGTIYEEDWQRTAAWGTPLDEQWKATLETRALAKELDIAGRSARTSPTLIAFRDWLVDDTEKHHNRRFLNATGGGILRGSAIEQVSLENVVRHLPGRGNDVGSRIAAAICRRSDQPTVEAARALLQVTRSDHPATDAVIASWIRFAPGLTAKDIEQVLTAAVGKSPGDATPATTAAQRNGRHPIADTMLASLQVLANAVPLVPLSIPPHALQPGEQTTRIFRFRSTTARIICCALQPPDEGFTEDGRSLMRVESAAELVPGAYAIFRDEVHFRASDDSDPRSNGRKYALLVTAAVAYAEQLPLEEILARGL